jgi:hypothetical protein
MEKELIDKLYEKVKLRAEEVKPTNFQKTKKFLGEYFGLIPTLGGIVVAGAAGIVTYAIGIAHGIYNGVEISSLYNYASAFPGKILPPAFLVGQFLTYRLKKSIVSIFK